MSIEFHTFTDQLSCAAWIYSVDPAKVLVCSGWEETYNGGRHNGMSAYHPHCAREQSMWKAFSYTPHIRIFAMDKFTVREVLRGLPTCRLCGKVVA